MPLRDTVPDSLRSSATENEGSTEQDGRGDRTEGTGPFISSSVFSVFSVVARSAK